jgi:transmembrane sensor
MNSDSSSSDSEAHIEESAATWLARRDRGLTGSEQDEFLQWLAEDPRHGEWIARHLKTIAGLKLLARWRPHHSFRPNPDLLALRTRSASSRFSRWIWPFVFGAAAAIALVFWRPFFSERSSVDEQLIVRKVLEDGSTIDLNHGAAVEVAYSPAFRNIRLVRGEAIFSVAKDPERPFIVDADGVRVRAVGTAFNVNLQSRKVVVLVSEGQVQVTPPLFKSGRPGSIDRPAMESQIVAAGQRTFVSLDEPAPLKIDAVTPETMARELVWQPRQLEFNDTPLAQVVAEFNSSNRTKMVIDVPALASLPVGASLRSDNVEGFVRLLEASFHIRAERRSDDVIVLRPSD